MASPVHHAPHLPFQACAFNGRDVDAIAGHAARTCRCIRDGEELGVGPEAIRLALQAEFRLNDEMVGRLMDLDGERVLVEFDGEGLTRPRGVLRMRAGPAGLQELRIDHDPAVVGRFGR